MCGLSVCTAGLEAASSHWLRRSPAGNDILASHCLSRAAEDPTQPPPVAVGSASARLARIVSRVMSLALARSRASS